VKKIKLNAGIRFSGLTVLALLLGLNLIGGKTLATIYQLTGDDQRISELSDYLSITDNQSEVIKPLQYDFVQPWLYSRADKSKIVADFELLKRAGFEGIILQNTVKATGGSSPDNPLKITRAYYNSNLLSYMTDQTRVYPSALDNIMDAAEEVGLKVYLGGVNNEEWWTISNHSNETWMTTNAEFANLVYDELYSLYHDREAFQGWYWWPEMFTNNYGLEKNWSDMVNITINHIDNHPQRFPFIIGAYTSSWLIADPVNVKSSWVQFMADTNLKDHDIFILQDKLARGNYPVETLVEYIKAFKAAADFKKNTADIEFNIITENFSDNETGIGPIERFKLQMLVSASLADNLYCFSYLHWYTPYNKDKLGSYIDESYDYEYRTFIGLLQGEEPEPDPAMFELTLTANQSDAGTVFGAGFYEAGSRVNIGAIPGPGYDFIGWIDSSGNIITDSTDTSFTMPEENITLTAIFIAEETEHVQQLGNQTTILLNRNLNTVTITAVDTNGNPIENLSTAVEDWRISLSHRLSNGTITGIKQSKNIYTISVINIHQNKETTIVEYLPQNFTIR